VARVWLTRSNALAGADGDCGPTGFGIT
jgi:hypothetical protein